VKLRRKDNSVDSALLDDYIQISEPSTVEFEVQNDNEQVSESEADQATLTNEEYLDPVEFLDMLDHRMDEETRDIEEEGDSPEIPLNIHGNEPVNGLNASTPNVSAQIDAIQRSVNQLLVFTITELFIVIIFTFVVLFFIFGVSAQNQPHNRIV